MRSVGVGERKEGGNGGQIREECAQVFAVQSRNVEGAMVHTKKLRVSRPSFTRDDRIMV